MVFIRVWSMFPFFFPWSHLFHDDLRVSHKDPNIWVTAQRNELHFSHDWVFYLLKYMLGFVGKRAAVPPQVLERKPHICVLIITNVGSSNPQDLGRLGGGVAMWLVVRYGRGDAAGVNILPNLTHNESLTLAGKDEQLFKYIMNEKLLTRVRDLRNKWGWREMNTQKVV